MNIKKNIAALLDRPHFQTADGNGQLPPDPTIPTRMKVTLDQLVPYHRNPRILKNPDYDETKESIRHRGLDHPPNITRQSPDKPYMIKDGGNTRLAILNELWQETQDTRFYELDCIFSPWISDFDVYVGHIIENDIHAPFAFVERAIAAATIKRELEAMEQTTFSLRELEKKFHKLGWTTVDFTNLGLLLYAHETLIPFIPNAFWSGMGKPSVKAIRKILDTSRTFWQSVATPDEGSFEDVWQSIFMELDNREFDINHAQNQLEAEIAQRLDSPMMFVSGEIQAIAQGISPGGVRPINILPTVENSSINNSSTNNRSPAAKPTSQAEPHSNSTIINGTAENIINNNGDEGCVTESVTQASITTLHHLISYSTQELMDNALGLALDYASHFGFDSCVELPSDHDFNGHDGFHSGFVLLPPSQEMRETIFANPNVILNYMYLFQLSNWCCMDNDNPAMKLVSINSPLSWLSEEYVDRANKSIMHMRALLVAMNLQGDPAGHVYTVMEELEATIGIIISRFSAHIAQGV